MNTRLRELRLERGLRQKDVAEKIGVCTASYGFYENWINKPDPETLVKLANLYNVTIDYLLGVTDDFDIKTSTDENNITHIVTGKTAQERELLELFRGLSPYLQGLTLDTVRSWAGKPGSTDLHKKA